LNRGAESNEFSSQVNWTKHRKPFDEFTLAQFREGEAALPFNPPLPTNPRILPTLAHKRDSEQWPSVCLWWLGGVACRRRLAGIRISA